MGIKDLLRFMKPFVEPIHIKKYAGKRVGIDAYSWLHKGAYSCSMELCLNSMGGKKLQYLNYFMHRINLLRHNKIIPVVVFDGGPIPCKAATEQARRRRRKDNLDLAMAKLNEGNLTAASELFQRAVSITPYMAHQLIQILRLENVEFLVAPYEADAQLAYLSSLEAEKGGIEAVITEDSDLMAYGCNAVIFKMDRYGNGEEIVLDRIFGSVSSVPSFQNFNEELFTGMCVLAGCDFLPSIPGIGIMTAYSLVSKYRNIERVLSVLKLQKGNQMPVDYLKSFKEAVAVFQHAKIYDDETKQLKHMKPIPEKLLHSLDGELDFLGPEIPPSIASAIAEGKLNPITMEAYNHFLKFEGNLASLIGHHNYDKASRVEAIVDSTQESCFTVLSSHLTKEEMTIKVTKQKPAVMEIQKYSKEAMSLEKLFVQSEVLSTIRKKDSDKNPAMVPNNNPFRKRKLDEIIREQQSVITDVEKGGLVCNTFESQESVDSKPNKVIGGIEMGENGKKLKRTNWKSIESKKTTILNFFSRV